MARCRDADATATGSSRKPAEAAARGPAGGSGAEAAAAAAYDDAESGRRARGEAGSTVYAAARLKRQAKVSAASARAKPLSRENVARQRRACSVTHMRRRLLLTAAAAEASGGGSAKEKEARNGDGLAPAAVVSNLNSAKEPSLNVLDVTKLQATKK